MRIRKSRIQFVISLLLLLPFMINSSFNTYVTLTQATEPENNLSIILMIGDGMGFEHVKLGQYVELGPENLFALESLPLNLSVMTHNADFEITDSAAAATAIATGVKTENKLLSIAPNGTILETILEIAQALGKATGVVTTTEIQHATPAAFMTHVSNRNDYDEITHQIVEGTAVDVVMGGGASSFSQSQISEMSFNGYQYVTNLSALTTITTGKLFGLFADGHMPYEYDRDYSLTPSLATMTQKAIDILSQNSSGFFLMVEGGRIDHASHSNDETRAALEVIEFEFAVRKAIAYVESHPNTILLVTADHETGGLMITGESLDEVIPNSSLTEEENRTLRVTRAGMMSISWSTTDHTNSYVPLYAQGNFTQTLTNGMLIDNTDIFQIMYDFYNEEEITLLPQSPVIVTPLPEMIILIPIAGGIIVFIKKLRKRKNQ
ncbi:MAG: hypothetical protein FK734_12525 [Asgard group archaeon]|nr:hypothetical protein [Asgard group archaeon]